jgi:hypothetical protein
MMIRAILRAVSLVCVGSLAATAIRAEDTPSRVFTENNVSADQVKYHFEIFQLPESAATRLGSDRVPLFLPQAASTSTQQPTVNPAAATPAKVKNHHWRTILISTAVIVGTVALIVVAFHPKNTASNNPPLAQQVP